VRAFFPKNLLGSRLNRSRPPMNRKFFSLVLLAAMAIAVGGMACAQVTKSIDDADETDSGT
jgi:hypothetical protein